MGKRDDGMAQCIECGSDGVGGMIEYSDGKLYHFRKMPRDGKVYPVLCCGVFVNDKEATK